MALVPNTVARHSKQPEGSGEDVQWMRRLALGDAEALEQLIRKYWRPLIRYAVRIMGSADGAEDVAQETFVALWEQRASWKASAPPLVYMYRITRNLALKEVRRREVRERGGWVFRSWDRSVPTPFDAAHQTELRAAFQAALERLPPRRREALVLVRYEGLSLREAAAIMQISVQTVANQVTSALAELKPLLLQFAME